jgi:maltooligosyltrehalose trehalohydrolase
MTRRLEVWAPHANRVELDLLHRRIAMERTRDGSWRAPSDHDGPYRFVLDGREPLPDPRSAWQPEGIFGPSHTVAHEAFTWSDRRWHGRPLAGSVLYEMHVGTFTAAGTFDAVIDRLDHVVALGVDAIELMPVAEFSGRRGWGYDGVFLFAPHHAYGGPNGLKRLVDACHARDLAVVLDVVYNHLGPAGNNLDRFGPYFTDRYGTPWGQAVNLDGPGSDEVRRFVCDNALHWLRDYHVDGLRIDAVHAIYDRSALHILEQLAIEVEQLSRSLDRTLWLIAESDLNDPTLVRGRDAHGYGLDAQWSDDFHHAVHAVLTNERVGYYRDFGSLRDVASALEHTFVYDGRRSAHRERVHGRAASDLPQHRFVTFLQNHDQIGNRATGERLSMLVDRDALFGGAALLLLGPFVPLLFQGEEWGATTPFLYFTDHEDAELAQAVRDGRRSEFASFGWSPEHVPDPQAAETFDHSKLRWEECSLDAHRELLDWHARLIALRRNFAADLVGGDERVSANADNDTGVIVMRRGRLVVAASLRRQPATLRDLPPELQVLAAHGHHEWAAATLSLAPGATIVLGPPALDREPRRP